MPWSFVMAGWLGGLILLSISAFFAVSSYMLYVLSSDLTQRFDLSCLLNEACGANHVALARAAEWSTLGMCVGNATNQLIIVADIVGRRFTPRLLSEGSGRYVNSRAPAQSPPAFVARLKALRHWTV